MSQYDSDPYLLQCAQDPLAGWDEFAKQQKLAQAEEEAKTSAAKSKSATKKGRKGYKMEMASYIINKSSIRGRKIIKLQVYDYDSSTNTYNEVVKLQHVVVNPFLDETFSLTENIISKVSKSFCDD